MTALVVLLSTASALPWDEGSERAAWDEEASERAALPLDVSAERAALPLDVSVERAAFPLDVSVEREAAWDGAERQRSCRDGYIKFKGRKVKCWA